jgi:dienelactone hydrolase
MSDVRTESLSVRRTARLALLGVAGPHIRDLWYVLHGYGQLAPEFLEGCGALADAGRLVVAPEALSRFYDGDLATRLQQKDPKVGASWMTREERLTDIADNMAYLDEVHAHVLRSLGGARPRVTVLGFSQGAATSTRWVATGSFAVARHVIWGAAMAHDVDLADPDSPLRRPETVLVVGTRDQFATPKAVAAERMRLEAARFPVRELPFDGGHRLDDETLRLLAGPPTDADATGAA